MSSNNAEEIKGEVKKYFFIFAILLTLSVTTVGISYLNLSLPLAIFLALSISAIQIFFAAGYFMHLISEKRMIIYIVLLFTLIFLVSVLFLPLSQKHNPITGTEHHNVY